MPELPEVETIKRELIPHLLNQTIKTIEIFDLKININPQNIINHVVKEILRKGKYLFWIFYDQNSLSFHMGMTGGLVFSQKKEDLRYLRARFGLNEGFISFCDSRRFGKIQFLYPEEREKLIRSLGVDPFTDAFSWERFKALFPNKTVSVKSFLMNQSWISGIGNIYANEILFLSKIFPGEKVCNLTEKEIKSLFHSISHVLNRAISCQGTTIRDYQRSDGSSGSFQNCLLVYNREKEPCFVCHTPIQKIKIAQRSTYFCPKCQK